MPDYPENLEGHITRSHVEKVDVDCSLEYEYVICEGASLEYHNYLGEGCMWEESNFFIRSGFSGDFSECCVDKLRHYERDYKYCEITEIQPIQWPYPESLTLSGVSEQLECESSVCPTGSWCYNVEAYLDWSLPTGDCENCDNEDPYDPDCPSDMDVYMKVGRGCLDTSDHTFYYANLQSDGPNMLSGSWSGVMNQDSHPNCACEPSGAEVITAGNFDENRDFEMWYNQFTDCGPVVSGAEVYFKVNNCGSPTLDVLVGTDTYTVAGGQSVIITGIAYAGYNTNNQYGFTEGTSIKIRGIHGNLGAPSDCDGCGFLTLRELKAVYDFNEAQFASALPLELLTSGSTSAYACTPDILDVGTYGIEVGKCPCDTGVAAEQSCVIGTSCCEVEPENKGCVTMTFGVHPADTGVIVDVPYVFYGTANYTGGCSVIVDNQKTGQCWLHYPVDDPIQEFHCGVYDCPYPPQNTIAYGGKAIVEVSKMISSGDVTCVTTKARDIPATCCPIKIDPDACENKRECTDSGEHPGGTGYSPDADFLTIFDMSPGESLQPFYEPFITGCLLKTDPNGNYIIAMDNDRHYTIDELEDSPQLCTGNIHSGEVVGGVYKITLDSADVCTEESCQIHISGQDWEIVDYP